MFLKSYYRRFYKDLCLSLIRRYRSVNYLFFTPLVILTLMQIYLY